MEEGEFAEAREDLAALEKGIKNVKSETRTQVNRLQTKLKNSDYEEVGVDSIDEASLHPDDDHDIY